MEQTGDGDEDDHADDDKHNVVKVNDDHVDDDKTMLLRCRSNSSAPPGHQSSPSITSATCQQRYKCSHCHHHHHKNGHCCHSLCYHHNVLFIELSSSVFYFEQLHISADHQQLPVKALVMVVIVMIIVLRIIVVIIIISAILIMVVIMPTEIQVLTLPPSSS